MGMDDNPNHVHEIESKFTVTDEVIAMIEDVYLTDKTKKFVDVYFDYDDNSLTQANIWLRMRDKEFELKLPNGDISLENKSFSSYTEILSVNEIATYLDLKQPCSDTITLLQAIKTKGMNPFVSLLTNRKSYILYDYGLKVDIDRVHTEGEDEMFFDCIIGEVEFIEKEGSSPREAIELISKFKQDFNLDNAPYGKVALYLQARKPEVFNLLQSKGLW